MLYWYTMHACILRHIYRRAKPKNKYKKLLHTPEHLGPELDITVWATKARRKLKLSISLPDGRSSPVAPHTGGRRSFISPRRTSCGPGCSGFVIRSATLCSLLIHCTAMFFSATNLFFHKVMIDVNVLRALIYIRIGCNMYTTRIINMYCHTWLW